MKGVARVATSIVLALVIGAIIVGVGSIYFIQNQNPAVSPGTKNDIGTKQQSTQRDDLGCFFSCTLFPEGFPRQMCEDWKAGKSVLWPSDCSTMQYGPCIKLCEVEKVAGRGGTIPQVNISSGQQQTSFNQPKYDTGIPEKDPNPDNVYIYFTDFKHGRIIRMDDMTGKNWVSFGTVGSGINQFNEPSHFFVQPDGHIYIAEHANHRIVRIDDMTGKGWVTYGSQGVGSVGHFNAPSSVRLDNNGRIYIVDNGNCRIVRIDDMTGAGWTEYGKGGDGGHCGQPATAVGELSGPKEIAFDSQGRIYISDDFDQRIVRIDDMTGKGWTTYGTKGTGIGQFLQPQAITFDSQGRIYVTDEDKNTQGGRVIRIDDMAGAGWAAFPPTSPDSRIALPHDTSISASGRLYIADTSNNGIVRIDDMTGKNYISYAPCANCQPGTDIHQLEAPKGIFVVKR